MILVPVAPRAVSFIGSCVKSAGIVKKVSLKAEKVAVDSWRYEKMYYLCNRKTKETRFTKTAKTYKVKVP